MYEVDSETGSAWLNSLRRGAAEQAAWVVDVRPSLRIAHDGSTEVLTMVVVRDQVLRQSSETRRHLLSEIERHLKAIIRESPFPEEGWPLIGFMTESDLLRERERAAG